MTDDITKELAEIVEGFRWFADMGEPVNRGFLTRVDAALELYAEPFMTSEKPKMTINLKDYEGKRVVATLRNELMLVSLVTTNTDYSDYPYIFYHRCYTRNGIILIDKETPYDIVDIVLAEEDPEPVITRVEVITDTGRDYVNWEEDNVITTSLQDEGRTLKVFVTQNTEESEMPITKPEFYNELIYTRDKTLYNKAEEEVSKQWALELARLVDELGGDSPALWKWDGKTPTPEKVVECLRENIQYLQQLAADEELEACLGLIAKRYSGSQTVIDEISSWMRNTRRPKPTLKSQALKDFETVRKHSDLLPEILDTIEKALKSIPDT